MSDQKELLSMLTEKDIVNTAHLIGNHVPMEAGDYFEAMDRIYAAAGILAEQSPEDAQAEAEERGITQYSRTSGIPQRQVESYWAAVKDHSAVSEAWLDAVLAHGTLCQGLAEARAADSELRKAVWTAAAQLRAERTAALLAAQDRITAELAKLRSPRARNVYLDVRMGGSVALDDIIRWRSAVRNDCRMVYAMTADGTEWKVTVLPLDALPEPEFAGDVPRLVPSFADVLLPFADEKGHIDPKNVDNAVWGKLVF